MPFEKVRPQKVSAIAAEQIIAAIKRGDYPVGSKLPSENELAERMGVSRPTIREALSALTAVGLIESKPGSGNYVRNPSDALEQELFLLIEDEASCLEIMEARELLEPPLAALAARKRTPEHVEKLRSIHSELKELAKTDDFDSYFSKDKEFHLALVEASGNTLLAAVLTPLVNTMDQKLYREFTRDYYFKNRLGLEEVASLHDEILEAVAAGKSALAARKMREHWERMQRAVSAR